MLTLLTLTAAFASAPFQCTTTNPTTSLFVDTDGHQTLNNLDVEGWEPVPVVEGAFYAAGDGCATALLSAHTLSGYSPDGLLVGDDYAVFVVELDGNPMYGHITGCVDPAGVNTSCVQVAHEVDGVTRVDAHSYSFTLPIRKGWHRVRVRYAGVDVFGTTARGAYLGGTILTVTHP
jgi:hypothetical protein